MRGPFAQSQSRAETKGTQVLTITGTAAYGVIARRACSYLVYCVGYRLLSVQLWCAALAVSGVPLMVKFRA
ncbi:hypothetical protein AWC17_27060 [Mycobacterium nebraskense]|uniref:Uncharacterized protein n=1 Tax=Mycobacterium nebraskense TaxID=244292 RepID=A0A0F5N6P1_9MYCO|nr:hypothetical protein WU83_26750 [Mycobacterium nebraskense]KKC01940.1 hypothetical protein WU83_26760 [Mycobacterium nebraskense]KLO25276.1 hypothetical protein ABW17_30195 [Mycobacterium nebraskense]ORW28733.1 hypothetical protein AWC17_27060 [Mycobacterium nebraskense]